MKKTVSIILAVAILLGTMITLTACFEPNACTYVYERDNEGRDIRYAKISFKDYGEVYLLLDATAAPISVENFLNLANSGFYDNLTIHRVIEDFMIQGGDPNADGTGGSDNEIYGEFRENGYRHNDLNHITGVISMARGDERNSASSQFFICNADASHLDGKYAAFGYVISGMRVVHKITRKTAKYGDDNGLISDKSKQVIILSITEITEEEVLTVIK